MTIEKKVKVELKVKGKIEINQERCKGCELCVEVCPEEYIEISKKSNKAGYFPAQVKNKRKYCTGCGQCFIICSDVCITVYRK